MLIVDARTLRLNSDLTTFEEAKSDIQHFYSDIQTSQSARLLGFVGALFVLIKAVQDSASEQLSKIFTFTFPINLPDFGAYPRYAELLLLFLVVWVLMTFIMRTVFRFSAYGSLLNYLIDLPPIKKISNQNIHKEINDEVQKWVKKDGVKLYVLVPITWFIYSKEAKSKWRYGWVLSFATAFILTLILLSLLW